MVLCKQKDCNKRALFGSKNDKIPSFCGVHKSMEYVNLNAKRCSENNCFMSPIYNFPSEKNGKYCKFHKLEDMILIKSKMCIYENCDSAPSFNFRGEAVPKWCSIHADKSTMVNVKHKKCLFEECNNSTSYGILGKDKVPMWCFEHADKTTMVNLKHKHYECKKCNLRWYQTRKDQELCRYCDPTKRQKSKENEIKKLLEKHSLSFVNDKTFENSCCLKYRPDFIFDCGSFFLVLEVDEYAHSSYPKECETIRMNNISFALGLPVKFVRYNPDNKEFSKDHKETVLVEIVKDLVSKEIIEDLEPVYLFYTK